MNKINTFFQKNKCSLILASILSLVTILVIFIFNLQNFSFETRKLSMPEIIFSGGMVLLCVILCIFMRIKRYSKLAKGLFYYQMIGFIAFALYFFTFIFNISVQSFFYTIFRSWTIPLEPIGVFLGRILGIKAKYLIALFYLTITFITGKTIIAIKKDIAYEKQYKEDHPAIS